MPCALVFSGSPELCLGGYSTLIFGPTSMAAWVVVEKGRGAFTGKLSRRRNSQMAVAGFHTWLLSKREAPYWKDSGFVSHASGSVSVPGGGLCSWKLRARRTRTKARGPSTNRCPGWHQASSETEGPPRKPAIEPLGLPFGFPI